MGRALAVILGLILFVCTYEGAKSISPAGRLKFTINEHWRYFNGDAPRGASPDLDDSDWEVVDLPHTWNAEDAYDKVPGYRRGIGWYRKRLAGIELESNRKYYVYFEGANQVAEVFMNGVSVGRHVGGYTAFVADISDELRWDGPNVLAVRVDNSHNADIPPLNADFTFFGGIYRDVWLVSTDLVHIDVTDHASPGVFVDTPDVSRSSGTVRVRGRVLNESDGARTLRIAARVEDRRGSAVSQMEASIDLAEGGSETFELTGSLDSPRLWSPADPYLYGVTVDLLEGEKLLDRVEVPLGFRWFEVDGRDGLTLNGQPLRLNGTNRHQDFPGYGNAVPNWVHRKDVGIIKDDGFNFLRLAHYPQDPVVLAETDRQGLVVWEEIPIVNMITLSESFEENSERMLVEMIRQHYNHPSILMWGYMNEVMLREPRPVPEGYYDRLVALTEHLEGVVEREDPHRLTVTAQSSGEVYNGRGISEVTDILGMNLYFGWYYDTFDSLGTFLDRLHEAHPERPLLVSEYGAGSDERIHAVDPRRFDFSSEHAQAFHRASFEIMSRRPYLVGSAVWNQFDFGSEGRQDSKNAINQKGLYFHDRTPKDVAYYYRAALLSEPVLHIADEWSFRAGSRPEDAEQPIWIHSNAPEVTLEVNGRSAHFHNIINSHAAWNVALSEGANRISARAATGSRDVVDETVIHYDDRSSFFEGGADAGDVLAVNAGGLYQFTGPDGVVWEVDRPYEPGNWGYVGGRSRLAHNRILGTSDDPLFQSVREGLNHYRFDVTDGDYRVEILLCETSGDGGRGPLSVFVNGDAVWTGVELEAAYGRYEAVRRAVEVEAAGGSGIEVRFEPPGSSTVAGILIRRE